MLSPALIGRPLAGSTDTSAQQVHDPSRWAASTRLRAARKVSLSLSLCLATQQCALSALYLSWFGPSEPFVGVCVLAAACKRAASSLPRGRRRKLAVAVSCLLLETESPVARLLASEYSSQASERAARNQFEAAVAQRATSERASERATVRSEQQVASARNCIENERPNENADGLARSARARPHSSRRLRLLCGQAKPPQSSLWAP